jgi:DNA-binding MarR family transcriptional regulator
MHSPLVQQRGTWHEPMRGNTDEYVDPIAEARDGWTAAGWGATALAMANVTSIMRVQQILLGRINTALRPHGLSHARLEVLMVLLTRPKGGLPLGKLGALLQVYPGAVTSAVDRLEADGLVRRAQHPTDGRGTLAMITQRGRRIAQQAIEDVNAFVLEPFTPDGAVGEQLFELLREVRSSAGDLARFESEPAA